MSPMQFKALTALVALALAVHVDAAALIRRGDYAPEVPPPELVPDYQPGVPGKTSPALTPDYGGQGQTSKWDDLPVLPVPVKGGPDKYLPPPPTVIVPPPTIPTYSPPPPNDIQPPPGIPKYTPPPPNDIQPPPVQGGIPKYTPPPPIDTKTPDVKGSLPNTPASLDVYVEVQPVHDIPNHTQPPPVKETTITHGTTGYGAPPPPPPPPPPYDTPDKPTYGAAPEIAKNKVFGGSSY